jgi:hypothetical protein
MADMCALFALTFVAAFAVIVWSAVFVFRGLAGTTARQIYIAVAIGIGATAYWSTFHYVYFWNANTRMHGWPVPYIIFQRDEADTRWDDFVGPTTVLALPMNFILFMFVPSLAFLGIALLKLHHKRRTR